MSKEEKLKVLCAPYSEVFNQEPVEIMAQHVIDAYRDEPAIKYPLEHATIEGVCLTFIREVDSGEKLKESKGKLDKVLTIFERTEPRARLIAESFFCALQDTHLTHNFDRDKDYSAIWTTE